MYEQPYNPYCSNVIIIKQYFKRVPVLLLGFAYLISAIISVWAAIQSSGGGTIGTSAKLIEAFLANYGTSSTREIGNALNSASNANLVVTIISAGLVPLLCSLAFFLVFGMSCASSESTSPSAGLMILRVLATISYVVTLIVVILIGVLYGIVLVFFIIDATRNHKDLLASGLIGLIVVGVILTVFASIILSYMASRKNFYRAAGYCLQSQNLYKKGAGKFGVYSIILAVISVIGLFRSLFLTDYFHDYFTVTFDWIDYLPDIVSIAIYILTAILALGYKSYINRFLYGFEPAPYDDRPMDGGYPPEGDAYQMPMYQQPFYDDRPNSEYDDDYDDRRYH